MTRYFYTDPLAAAWMCFHHGMEFEGGFGFGCEYRSDGDPTRTVDQPAHLRIYIHPDSLPLLEPRDGDLAIDRNGNVARVESFAEDRLIGKRTRRVVVFGGCYEEVARIDRVLERHGKPFHWPEAEAA